MTVHRRSSIDLVAERTTVRGIVDLIAIDAPWMNEGLCAQTDPESFFPEKGGSTREAKATCRKCPVKDDCLAYALDHVERFGIWGGLSERERRRVAQGRTANPDVSKPSRRREGPHNSTYVLTRLKELGTTSHEVRAWAIAAGIPHVSVRGLVSLQLIDRYAEAHPEEKTA